MDSNSREFPNMRLDFIKAHPTMDIIAAAGFRSCIVMNTALEVLQRHLDSNKTEKFYCIEFADLEAQADLDEIFSDSFSSKEAGSPEQEDLKNYRKKKKRITHYLCLGGESGVIKLINLAEGILECFLKGHTGAIYSLKVMDTFLFSSSEDSTIRVWDLITCQCIGVFGGIFGHRDQVISIDINPTKEFLVSTGRDCTIKQWRIDEKLKKYKEDKAHIFFHKPDNNFENIHKSQITRIRYYGDMIVSLSNNTVSVIYNNRKAIPSQVKLGVNDPVFIGSIDLYDNCRTFDITENALIGLSTTGDIYMFDLREIGKEKTPFIIGGSKFGSAEDFTILDDTIVLTTGKSVHEVFLDISRFEYRED